MLRPNARAALLRVSRVRPVSCSSSNRSRCERLVCMRSASAFFVIPFAFIASASCQAITRLIATALAASSMPSSARKSSYFDPIAGFFLALAMVHLMFAPPRGIQIVRWRFLRFLDESMQQDHRCSIDGEQQPGNSSRDATAHFPQSRFHFANQRHAQRPAELHGLDVVAEYLACFTRQFTQPITYRF